MCKRLQGIGNIHHLLINFCNRLRRSSKSSKFDKKYLVFGEKDEEGEDLHFLGIIKRTLREALDGLLTSGEVKLKYNLTLINKRVNDYCSTHKKSQHTHFMKTEIVYICNLLICFLHICKLKNLLHKLNCFKTSKTSC